MALVGKAAAANQLLPRPSRKYTSRHRVKSELMARKARIPALPRGCLCGQGCRFFEDPCASFNPRQLGRDIVGDPLLPKTRTAKGAQASEVMPGLIIADEPVPALDVSIEARSLNLMMERETNLAWVVCSSATICRRASHRRQGWGDVSRDCGRNPRALGCFGTRFCMPWACARVGGIGRCDGVGISSARRGDIS